MIFLLKAWIGAIIFIAAVIWFGKLVEPKHTRQINPPPSQPELPSEADAPAQKKAQENSRRKTYWNVYNEMARADKMDGHDFEQWCAAVLRGNGFYSVEVTPGSGDHGADIIAHKRGMKWAIQCKRYSHDLGNKPVQEVYTGMAVYGCSAGAVMTNQGFTDGARTAAKATGIELWGREELKRMVERALDVEIEEEDLWPHYINTGNIDFEYYKALPPVPLEPGMPEYIDCEPNPPEDGNPYLTEEYNSDSDFHIIEIVSPVFDTKEEAEHFKRALEKRYYAYIMYVRPCGNGEWFFSAYLHGKYVLDRYDEAENCFHLENWA